MCVLKLPYFLLLLLLMLFSGCLLGVLLIVILVFLIRIYVFKKPIPARFAAAQKTLRNKFGPAKLDENVIYQSSGDIEPQKNNQVIK